MFSRKIYDKLLEWKGCNGRYSLLIEGARGVGKTTLAEEFARNEYRSYVLIDFSKPCDEFKDLFENHFIDLDDFFMRLSVMTGTRLYRRESLIIFDEVQEYPPARAALKHLVEDGRYDYVDTGSLISIRKNIKDILIPSEEHTERMYPMDFEEFCLALGEASLIEYIRKCYSARSAMGYGMHERAMCVFEEYLLIGGMPSCVDAYVSGGKDIAAAEDEKRVILEEYRRDITGITPSGKSRVAEIYEQIPSFLSSKNKRVVFSHICEGTSADDYRNALSWLKESMICNVVPQSVDPGFYMPSVQGRRPVKCYMGDTGLLLERIAEDDESARNAIYADLLRGNISTGNSSLYENAVAQMLTAAGHDMYYYSKHDSKNLISDVIINFFIRDNEAIEKKIVPIVLRRQFRSFDASLNRFKEIYGDIVERCVVIRPGNLETRGDTLCVPPYMIFCF